MNRGLESILISMKKILVTALFLASLASSFPVDTATVPGPGGTLSFIAKPAAKDGVRRPALVLAPEWWGLNTYAQQRARELASEGYVVLAVDLYGKRHVASDAGEAGMLAGAYYGDPSKFRGAMTAAVDALRARSDVDSSRLGALGFCFGGTAVLEGARAGLPFKAVATFHGGVKPFAPTSAGAVKGRVLVLHGGADPHVSMDDVAALVHDFETAHADYSVVVYPHAVHAFTNPASGSDPSKGIAYDANAEKASFEAFHRLLAETGLKP